MRSATRLLLGALALTLVAGTASAQNNVTFTVNMQPYITSCQHVPATDRMEIRGNVFGWDDSAPDMTDNGDGTYSHTAALDAGTAVSFKFWSSGTLAYEDQTGDRMYTVTGDANQVVPTINFADGDPVNSCGPPTGTPTDYTLVFAVDMSVQIGRGAFNPATQEVAVAGSFTDWGTSPVVLQEDSGTAGLYAGFVNVDDILVPSGTAVQFKFIIRETATGNILAWENVDPARTSPIEGGNRVFTLTGTEPDVDADGRLDAFYDNNSDPNDLPFFSDQDASQFLAGPATLTFNVDARSAQYLLAATGQLPGGETTFTGLSANGPAAGESTQDGGPGGGIGDWADWGPVLAAAPGRQLTDTDGDGIWTVTFNYEAGARRNLVVKFGVNGADNESGFGGDHQIPITEGANTYNLAFGCVRQADGTFIDETGGTPPTFTDYDEYLLIRNDLTPPTCVTVQSGGIAGDVMNTAISDGPSIAGLEIGATYPNPAAGRASVNLTLDRAMDVTVRLYDLTGRQIATLVDGQLAAGQTPVAVDAQALPAGVYVLRVAADGQVVSRRLTVVR